MGKVKKHLWLLVPLVALILLPFSLPGYMVRILVLAGIFAIAVMGLDLILGYGGQLALCQTGFMALGAYTSAILTVKHGVSPLLASVMGLLATCLIAYFIGRVTLRLRGIYFAMITIAFAIVVINLLLGLRNLTGGATGIRYIPPLAIGDLTFDSDMKFFYLAWGMVTVLFILSRNLIRSRIGRALYAIQANQDAADGMGINVARCKLQIFVVAAAFGALAGSFYAHYMKFVVPSVFGMDTMIVLLLMLYLGGKETLWGGALGAAFLRFLPDFLGKLQDYSILAYGLIFVLVLLFFPGGLAAAIKALDSRIRGSARPASVLGSPGIDWNNGEAASYGAPARAGILGKD